MLYDTLKSIAEAFIDPANPISIIGKGLIWIIAVLILAAGVDEGLKRQDIKAGAGLFFFFLTAITVASFLIFGIKVPV